MKMKGTKKAMAGGLAAILLVSMVSACSNGGQPAKGGEADGKKSVTLYMLVAESLFNGKVDEFVKKYESQNPGVTIKAEVMPDGNIFDSLRTKISTGDVPDLYQINIGHVTTKLADESGYLYDLSPLSSTRNYTESIRQASMYNGKYAAFTLGVGVLGLNYNKKLLADIGYAAPPKTWEEFMDAGKKLKSKGKDLIVYASKWETSIANVFHWTFGNYALKHEEFKKAYLAGSVDWSKPENKALLGEGFERFKELNQYVRKGSFTNEYAIAQQAFANGEAAMLLGGTWEAGAIRKLNSNLDWGFANLPYAPDSENGVIFVPEDGLALNAKSKNVEEAAKFANWLFSKETYGEILKVKGNFPAMPGVGELDPAYADVPKWLETGRIISFANTGPVPGPAWIALGQAAQEYTYNSDANKAAERFVKEYDKSKSK
ncbi:ABC-type glycerol-3-phosphate transport system, substrate-binding protein [Paenibacillus tianmuensis]|uniref:ABC-type glycerol-3-phosphate transport system, substrate-binding protein n=1 Tax=Paenibacillus tianmuensis TaxID=624147 RepID=A0A1G4T8U6_9BACL|nr:extracellular solute-binding protein [Paenibacillus tianmuensis]SCW77225.1 ABC-type glycerol-3-phosphate transport system, substrate-binding protein [Paenibacillus tianmuensis]